MDWDFWIIAFAVVMVLAAAYSLYGRSQRRTGIAEHPVEDQSGAPAAGEPRGDDAR